MGDLAINKLQIGFSNCIIFYIPTSNGWYALNYRFSSLNDAVRYASVSVYQVAQAHGRTSHFAEQIEHGLFVAGDEGFDATEFGAGAGGFRVQRIQLGYDALLLGKWG